MSFFEAFKFLKAQMVYRVYGTYNNKLFTYITLDPSDCYAVKCSLEREGYENIRVATNVAPVKRSA